jgi:hypothetical protein
LAFQSFFAIVTTQQFLSQTIKMSDLSSIDVGSQSSAKLVRILRGQINRVALAIDFEADRLTSHRSIQIVNEVNRDLPSHPPHDLHHCSFPESQRGVV